MTRTIEFAIDFPDILRLRLRLDELSEALPEFTDDYHRS